MFLIGALCLMWFAHGGQNAGIRRIDLRMRATLTPSRYMRDRISSACFLLFGIMLELGVIAELLYQHLK
jgi:hypothetical protein